MAAPAPARPSSPTAFAALGPSKTPHPQAGFAPDRREYLRAPDGLFYVDAHVNGQPTRFVVDTGASVIVLNRADADRLNVRYPNTAAESRIRTVGGSSAMRWAQIDTLNMAGREIAGLRAAVVETGIGVSLLGQNALSQFGTVTLRGNVLTID